MSFNPSPWSYEETQDPITDQRTATLFTFPTDVQGRLPRTGSNRLIIRAEEGREALVYLLVDNPPRSFDSARGRGYSNQIGSQIRFDQEAPRGIRWRPAHYNPIPEERWPYEPRSSGGHREFIWQMLQHNTMVVRFFNFSAGGSEIDRTLTYDISGLREALAAHHAIPLADRPNAFTRLRTAGKVAIGVVIALVGMSVCSAVICG